MTLTCICNWKYYVIALSIQGSERKHTMEEKRIIFIDSEISLRNHKIDDLGAIKENGDIFHSSDIRSFATFIQKGNFLCGHNIVHHDLKYLAEHISRK